MDIFDGLRLVGGLALFLLGMNLMGDALEKKAGGKLKTILENLTSNPLKGFLLGLGVTAIIQSSSATTVMVVGFVSAGVMTLHQAIYIIMGANVGTTVTAWLLSLAGIDGTSFFLTLLKPSSFTPVLALIGIVLYLFCKAPKRKDTGMILLGFAVLMTGMSEMSGAGCRTCRNLRTSCCCFPTRFSACSQGPCSLQSFSLLQHQSAFCRPFRPRAPSPMRLPSPLSWVRISGRA